MPRILYLLFILLILSLDSYPQEKHEIAAIVQYLSSPRHEGREIGTPGAETAAEYIASQFMQTGLRPYHTQTGNLTTFSNYYQTFKVQRYAVKSCTITLTPDTASIHQPREKSEAVLAATQHLPAAPSIHLLPGEDFTLKNTQHSISVNEHPVWAGYGINEPAITFQSYDASVVAGKIAVIRQGYPGMHEKWGKEWNKYKTTSASGDYGLEQRCKQLADAGASMVIILPEGYPESVITETPSENSGDPCRAENLYQDAVYLQLHNTLPVSIPLMYLSKSGAEKYYRAGDNPKLQLQLEVMHDTIPAINVLGLLPGKDTSKTLIIGAHYDHLGRRADDIYTGADDNASGVAGVITLAKYFTGDELPEYNILFASWTGEEKGILGSEYFTSLISNPSGVMLYLNMDMISRSAADDINQSTVSIGTRIADEHLRKAAKEVNEYYNNVFSLDLWEVDGHHGSDYASFITRNIPVATFFSGFHNDYHSPCDEYQRIDPDKAVKILRFIERLIDQID